MSEFEIIHEAFGQKAPNKFSQRIKEIFGINFESKNYGLWLHTLEIFGSHSDWLRKEIENNKKVFENEFNTFFNK